MLDIKGLFDESYYLSQNPDVAQVLSQGKIESGFAHFNSFGKFESRNPSALFDTKFYLQQYQDVKASVDQRAITAIDQFVNFGQIEGRNPIDQFDTNYYLTKNADVAQAVKASAGKKDLLTGMEHFVNFGEFEGRDPNAQFNTAYYLQQNPDVAAAVKSKTGGLSALKHFIQFGQKEGRFGKKYSQVLLLSIDGLRQADIADTKLQPNLKNILSLAQTGVTYNNVFSSVPSDSFPGTLAYFTGASPKTTGVYYDDSYDRSLAAPGSQTNSPGTEVAFAENIDKNPDLLSGGGNFGAGSIDPGKLPLDFSSGTGKAVYPHNYLKVNTIFDIAKASGLRTAYAEKHPSYDLITGANGNSVDDLYTPEINAQVALENGKLVDKSTAQNPASLTFKTTTKDFKLTEAYDDLKVNAILNEIKGLNSSGTATTGIPAIFGMNFQAVSVAQKDRIAGGIGTDGTPSAELIDSLAHTDASIGQIFDGLKRNNLFDSTLVILTAKHGQSPRLGSTNLVKDDVFTNALKTAGVEVAQATQDDVVLLWLKNQNQASQANQILINLKSANPSAGIDQVLSGDGLVQAGFGNPLKDNRTPDLIVKLNPGFVLVGNPVTSTKNAEHGGFSDDDTHVALIVGSSSLATSVMGTAQTQKVATTQIAVTALRALGLNPAQLQGATLENTQALPGL